MSSSAHDPAAVGVDIGGTSIKVAVVARDQTVLSRRSLPADQREAPGLAVARLALSLRELQGEAGDLSLPVGIGCAGLIERGPGIVRTAPNLPTWKDVPLAGMLAEELGTWVLLDNDANVFSVAEGFYGTARDKDDAIFVTLGTGVGGGLKLAGRLYRGSRGFAGEIGHMTIDPDGPLCTCGNRGCLESFIGSSRIVQRALALIEEERREREWLAAGLTSLKEITAKHLGEAARKGNELAVRVFEEVGDYLGLALANLTNILNPEVIVVGGGVANAGRPLFRAAELSLTKRAMGPSRQCVDIWPASFGDDAGVVGAAMIAVGNRHDRGLES
ncbi:MAG: ROK family protein [Candidatus Eisenbacteria bacterium]